MRITLCPLCSRSSRCFVSFDQGYQTGVVNRAGEIGKKAAGYRKRPFETFAPSSQGPNSPFGSTCILQGFHKEESGTILSG